MLNEKYVQRFPLLLNKAFIQQMYNIYLNIIYLYMSQPTRRLLNGARSTNDLNDIQPFNQKTRQLVESITFNYLPSLVI